METESNDLEARVAALEAGAKFDATKEAVKAVEAEFLMKLRDIKSAMQATNSGSANSKELQVLKEENELLKKKNAKLEYRIQHVLSHFEEVYNEQGKAKKGVE